MVKPKGIDDALSAGCPITEKDCMSYTVDAIENIVTEIAAIEDPIAATRDIRQKLLPVLKDLDPILRDKALPRWAKKLGLKQQTLEKEIKIMSGETTKDEEPEYIARFPNLVDIVEKEGNPVFLIKDQEELVFRDKVMLDGKTFLVPPREKLPWDVLPDGDQVVFVYDAIRHNPKKTLAAIYDELLDYHKNISELPHDSFYDVIVAWDFHTYLLDFPETQFSPFLWFYGDTERGKTRTGKGMTYVAYRGLVVECLREAYMIRLANDFGITLFFDVVDLSDKAEKTGSQDVLLARYEKGQKVPRVLFPEKGTCKHSQFFQVFGATVVATNEPLTTVFETRAIQVTPSVTTRQFDIAVTEDIGLPFKEALLAFRAFMLGRSLPPVPPPTGGRLGDILKPLAQTILLVRPERIPMFMQAVRIIKQQREMSKADTVAAQVVLVVQRLAHEVINGVLPIKNITQSFNEGKPEKQHFTPHRIGRVLAELGFQKRRTENGAMAIVWDEAKINAQLQRYGLKDTNPCDDKLAEVSEDMSTKTQACLSCNDKGSGFSEVSEVFGEGVCACVPVDRLNNIIQGLRPVHTRILAVLRGEDQTQPETTSSKTQTTTPETQTISETTDQDAMEKIEI
jgi:hypothetical protein